LKKVYKILANHIGEDFHLGIYLSTAIFLAASLTLNFFLDIENSFIDKYYGSDLRILWYFLLYSFAFYSTAFVVSYFRKDKFIKKPLFWIFSLAGVFAISFDAGFHRLNDVAQNFPVPVNNFVFKLISNLRSFATIFIPIFLFKTWIDKNRNGWYGLKNENPYLKSYIYLLAFMIPLLLWASSQDGFLRKYPFYNDYDSHLYLNWPEWILALVYELSYGWDLMMVEYVFRGFMVIGLSSVIGKEAILPMVSMYAFLHFGKPLPEILGSIFGGYILGIIAFCSRNIWGGVFIHIGIAWMMELFAYLRKL
jgi:hypothetical protein